MIEIKGLSKKYGKFTALEPLDLQIEAGCVFGFVGQNGAGKSTTFSILATLLAPTSGTATINGADIIKQPKEVRKQLGYMPDFFGVYDQLKAEEYLDFYGASYGISAAQREKLIPQLLELVNLSHKRKEYVDLLSRGMKQRLCLARSLIHDPAVLILDEPASGLDPRARIEMREILKELKNMGKTILISSHILPELAEMCDVIGILDQGKLVAQGTVSAIQQQLQSEKIINVKTFDVQKTIAFLEESPRITKIEVLEDGKAIQFLFKGGDKEQLELLKTAIQKEIPIISFSEMESNLEDVFMEITKEVEFS
ncbi:ABC transporter ATP-binding protein [Niallia circulans]|jgi:ABC-2 type transport system ATP-binding protein|uniref:ABC transporter n=1 Tax=Niallia circulans TaxID=1397 RepID=A0A0J1IQQ9_NIACI|nr:ABC transporter ATP-binding protein [Niallia circulans]KLV28273.1 ABC transporter [Niallia circulans]MCM2979761.1 ABC transporter ATP-binding protein [Niallia circulans]MDR4315625.1 ABC transporter ATP-binding protein [Niallia circulans]MED3837129.1 ABC transporter ATP-binding protein [Niallia circulans]MED4244199.1 ABC transporter ATP-binding protein [Niallia circulans]